ncbi:flagellar motor protein MotB [Magnetovibrio sp.]|uniref:OmpA/MotB family protein n=1 Tax=Magnetovibrio sp. TaxID=2024836 RepID=UPI002F92228F
MPPPPPLTEEPEDEEWLTTYADAITLLMAFFVMLVSFSKIDLPLFEEVMSGIQQEIGMGAAKETTTSEVKTKIEEVVFQIGMEQMVEVQKDTQGVTIEMANAGFFKPGTADIKEEAIPLIYEWGKLLTKEEYKYFLIEVEGHTDDDPIHTAMFPSNWELSSDRAAAVVRTMQSGGVHRFQLKVAGFGDSHPKVPNRDIDGNPIKLNQAKNRRVVVRLVPMDKKLKDEFIEILLEERLAEEERKRRQEEKAKQDAIQQRLKAAESEQQMQDQINENLDGMNQTPAN